ncbi:hypothetical protein MANES_05G161800v8 [Manihot esculenta]|uniref:Uncharacterized protein n=1 Tax=Manihot esculenta TaxID=3983 RepID=A0ACB7HQW1_MANES|nr:hypothetical protein MANES_05G161800v8 [Manihot esculenta]
MDETGGKFSSPPDIPSGLNRIKTRPVPSKDQLSSKSDDLTKSNTYVASRPPVKGKQRQKQKQKSIFQGRAKVNSSRGEELYKGKKITRWFSSYFSKDAGQVMSDVSTNIEESSLEAKTLDKKEQAGSKISNGGNYQNGKQSSLESLSRSKMTKGLKSFSHELGTKGSITPVFPRAHSYSDLEEILGSLHSRFDAAKEVVNVELASFAGEVVDVLEKIDSSLQEDLKMGEDLLTLAQLCMEMNCAQFRIKCEIIVQDLTKKRQQCQTGLLKWLFTRMLFILTRCTRLLQFQKDTEPIDEKSLHKFKKCLESVPSVEMSWAANHGIGDSDIGCALNQKGDIKQKLLGQNNLSSLPEAMCCGSQELDDLSGITSRKDSLEQKLPSLNSNKDTLSQLQQFSETDKSSLRNSLNNSSRSLHGQGQLLDDSLHEQEQILDGSDSVICRICEEIVPISHLESHSYICAYADKCDLNCLDVDERLSNLAEILEQIVESRNLNVHPSYSPENSKAQTVNAVTAEVCSPKISEWRNKGVEGMFEDIHEMDTAFIDDSHLLPANLKGHFGIKLCNYGATSSTGSMTSVSSTTTPRAGHFDSFWLEHNNPSESEDIQQMIDLADIARCVAGTDLSKEGSYEFLLACMQDLQDVLQNSKLRALVIDTFGGRIEKLLREKYILACDVMDTKTPTSDGKLKENSRLLFDNASQSSPMSTPVHSSHKERTSIDDFEIIKPISRGAFGKVFLARKRITGDLFAIKVLKKLDMLCKNDVQRILAERNILITVRNPFVLTDFGLSKIGLINSTIELSGPEMDGNKVSGVHSPHTRQSEDRSQHSAVGTPDYLAPEILLGTDHGYAADWWSVGIILFELITGIPPFNAESPEIIFYNILNRKIPWPPIPDSMSYEAQDFINRLITHDPNQRLGAKGSTEVKSHPFFRGVDWDNLALQKAVFVPSPDSADDTSYFISRFSQISSGMPNGRTSSCSDIEGYDSSSNSGVEMDEYGDLAEFDSSPLSLINFSFKNLSQLASINHDLLLQTGRDSAKHSPSRAPDT